MQQRITPVQIKSYMAAVVTIAAAVIMLGGSVTAATMNGSSSNSHHAASHQDKESQEARNLRIGLDALLREHVTTNLSVNRSIASGATDAEINVGIQAQIANSDSLAAAVGSIYGPEAEAQFSEMFLEHIEESNNFARAIAAGDETAKEAANEELQEYLQEIATFFSTAIPVLSYDAVYGLLLEHESLINESTEALSNNFGQSKKFEQQALRQISVVADALASGIIQTQPDKF